jgi:arginine decarboxylase
MATYHIFSLSLLQANLISMQSLHRETVPSVPAPFGGLDSHGPNSFGDTQRDVPFADALRELAAIDWQRLHVPAHQGSRRSAPELAEAFGEETLKLDFPMMFSQINQETWEMVTDGPSPLVRSQALAAEAWGASKVWFLNNGASMGNHVACLAARILGPTSVVQRSMHSSVIDGMIFAGINPVFIAPNVDSELGAAHGITAEQVDSALKDNPAASSVYLVSPSYFGAIADIEAIADTAHKHGVPLIVDEAWGSHLGFHPDLPKNSIRLGADLAVSSTHKLGGSLFQSAMLMLGHGPHAERLGEAVERVFRSTQSTSSSALLLLSLDEARRRLALHGPRLIGENLEKIRQLTDGIRDRGRFRVESDRIAASPDVFARDPFKVVINTRIGGISGDNALHLLLKDHRVYVEMCTQTAIIALVGPQSDLDVDRFLNALHALPYAEAEQDEGGTLPMAGRQVSSLRDAYFAQTVVVSAEEAVGRISADSLAAYPPGIPNVLPGEILTESCIEFLRATAATPAGRVRGAITADVSSFRVVDK